MQVKSVFHLFAPNLFQKLKFCSKDFSFETDIPNLNNLLHDLDTLQNKHSFDFESAFFNLLDPSIQELPSAHYRFQIHNHNHSDKYKRLICADPVHLQVGMNDVTLTSKITDLTSADAKELIALLNNHFKDDDLEFIYGSNECWYVAFETDEQISSHNLESMLMRNVIDKQLKSEQRNWQVIQNETQMLLFNSEVNRHREMAGLDTINSLWFWGAGKPINSKTSIDHIYYSRETHSTLLYEYLAKAANCELSNIPDNFDKIINEHSNLSTNVLLLNQLNTPTSNDEVAVFENQLREIDFQLIGPLVRAWKKDKIQIEINCCDGNVLKPIRRSIFKSWLKPKKLRELVNEASS